MQSSWISGIEFLPGFCKLQLIYIVVILAPYLSLSMTPRMIVCFDELKAAWLVYTRKAMIVLDIKKFQFFPRPLGCNSNCCDFKSLSKSISACCSESTKPIQHWSVTCSLLSRVVPIIACSRAKGLVVCVHLQIMNMLGKEELQNGLGQYRARETATVSPSNSTEAI